MIMETKCNNCLDGEHILFSGETEFAHQKCLEETQQLNRSRIAYFCSFVPEEIIYSAGFLPYRPSIDIHKISEADLVLHNNLCPYVRNIFEYIHLNQKVFKGIIITNSCDAMRRLNDAIHFETQLDFLYLLDIPRETSQEGILYFETQINNLVQSMEQTFSISITKEKLNQAISLYNQRRILIMNLFELQRDYKITGTEVKSILNTVLKSDPEIGIKALKQYFSTLEAKKVSASFNKGAKIYFYGCINDKPEILDLVEKAGGNVIREDTCTGYRHFERKVETNLPPTRAMAERYLMRPSCARMKNPNHRITEVVNNIHHLGIDGVIFHSVKFCDYYGFDFSYIKAQTQVPILEIETDYTIKSAGQLKTRIEAFMEKLNSGKQRLMTSTGKKNGKSYLVGIDSGSTTTKIAIINHNKELIDQLIVFTGASSKKSARKAFDEILNRNSIQFSDIGYIIATGYGRNIIDFADENVTEITCHSKGVLYFTQGIRTILDIGGQDSKAIKLMNDGEVEGFSMNDKCAAGTGRFLEVIARTLEIPLEELGDLGLQSTLSLSISSMCTVFAESEVISLIAEGHKKADIASGVFQSIANRSMGLIKRVQGEPPFAMSGGVAKNIGMVRMLEQKLGEKLHLASDPQICGAVGAAIIAYNRVIA